jgi:hypothetical protein
MLGMAAALPLPACGERESLDGKRVNLVGSGGAMKGTPGAGDHQDE